MEQICFENICNVISGKSVNFHSEILQNCLFNMMGYFFYIFSLNLQNFYWLDDTLDITRLCNRSICIIRPGGLHIISRQDTVFEGTSSNSCNSLALTEVKICFLKNLLLRNIVFHNFSLIYFKSSDQVRNRNPSHILIWDLIKSLLLFKTM